jgi:hypothetical protein
LKEKFKMAIPLLAMLGIGAATGMVKNQGKQAEYDRQKKIQAETTRMSPWTGMRAEAPVPVNAAGNILEGAMTGLSLHQGMGRAAKQDELMDAYKKNLLAGTSGAQAPMYGSAWSGMQAQPYSLGLNYKF